jgi:hypothetical protein
MRKNTMRITIIPVVFLACTAMQAGTITFISQPDAAYTSATTLIPITDPEGSVIGSLSDSNLTISFFSGGSPELMQVDQVPDSWATWGAPPNTESSTPTVLASFDTDTEILYQLSQPVSTFGMELEPDDTANAHDITASFLLSGVPQATLTLNVNGNGGALLFAATGGRFDAIDVSSDVDFAAAEFRYEPVPEPSSWIFMAAALGALAYNVRRSAKYRPTPQ